MVAHFSIGILAHFSISIYTLCTKTLLDNIASYIDFRDKFLRAPKSCYIEDLRLTKEECKEDFEEIADIVASNYQAVARHKGIDLDKLRDEYRLKVEKAENAQEYGYIVAEYLSDLKNMHTHPFFLKYESYGISLVTRNDSVWISKCSSDVNVRTKDLIIGINGMSTTAFIQKELNITPASTEAYGKKYAAMSVLSSYTDACRTLTIQRGDSIFDVSVPLYKQEISKRINKKRPSKTSLVERKENQILSHLAKEIKELDNIGYVRIANFDEGCVESFMQQMDSLWECSHLILDVRNNTGGRKGYVMNIAKKLTSKKTVMGKTAIECDSLRYKGKIYILMNEVTSSGGEFLVAVLKGQPNVTVIGRLSGGDCDSMGCNFRTSHGIEFRLATEPAYLLPDGITYSEGEGIKPDIEVPDLLPWEKGDNAFKTAMELILKDKIETYKQQEKA